MLIGCLMTRGRLNKLAGFCCHRYYMCVVVCCSVLQCVAVCCSVSQDSALMQKRPEEFSSLHIIDRWINDKMTIWRTYSSYTAVWLCVCCVSVISTHTFSHAHTRAHTCMYTHMHVHRDMREHTPTNNSTCTSLSHVPAIVSFYQSIEL